MSEIKKVPLNQVSQYVIMKLGDYEIGVYRLESFSEIEEYKLQEGSWEVQFPFPNSEIKRKVIGFLNSCQTRPFSNKNDNIKVTKKGNIKTTNIGYFF